MAVFPAYAGMFRNRLHAARVLEGFPRIRGDVPLPGGAWFLNRKFSPHTRGCSASNGENKNLATVFPAYAGMFRLSRISAQPAHRFPRIRGDVPCRKNTTHFRG